MVLLREMTSTLIEIPPPCPAESFKSIEQARAEMLQERQYEIYLTTYDSHVRLAALLDILPRISDDEYWPLIRFVWTSAEVTLPEKETWLRLLQAKRPGRDRLMIPSERRFLARLPDTVTIYRGCGHAAGIYGLSWTFDYERAKFFAAYACGPRRMILCPNHRGATPMIAKATCTKDNVLAYINGRNESEIIVDPASVILISARECGHSRG